MFYNRTYFDKCATIVKGSKINTGLNPVSDLVYGRNNSRFLFHFGHNRIKGMVDDKVFPDITKLKHYLKITNAGSLDLSELHKVYGSQIDGAEKKRASSFDLIFFLLPCDWDNGKGFDYTMDYFNIDFYDKNNHNISNNISEDGANWFQASNGRLWKENINFQVTNDDQFTFFIKSDKQVLPYYGGRITFTYLCNCNDNECLRWLEFKLINNTLESPVVLGNPVFYSASGMVCRGEEEILKYAKYIKIVADFPRNNDLRDKKFAFRLEFDDLNGNTYKSNPYKITQYGLGNQTPKAIPDDGVYSTDTLQGQIDLYENGEESIIIGKQHFDIGCENISIDITDTFNKFITGEYENHGIGIAFAPYYESVESNVENYVGLLTNRTNSFFEPYVETIYTDSISDDRSNFVLGKDNKLYLYANIGGDLVNLDQLPTCSVNDNEYEVKQASKGIYYIDIKLPNNAFTAPTMLYDTWDDIIYHEEHLKPVEMEFATVNANSFFQIGYQLPDKAAFTPTCYGINDNEHIKRGDLRKVCFLFKKDYAKNVAVMVDSVEVRLYIMDGTAQVTVIPYMQTNRAFNETYIMIDTSILVPNTYYMDVRVKYGMEMIEHHNVLSFTIVNEENNRYA